MSRFLKQHLASLMCLLVAVATPPAFAFDMAQLSQQLSQHAVVHGPFIQEKHLRGLSQPLLSSGEFVLNREHGLLWQLRKPMPADYRIDNNGIALRNANGWQAQAKQGVAAQQSRIFLAVLKGDHQGLEQDFAPNLSGTAESWQLTLTPRSLLLQQIFQQITISGAALVERIELVETQGDSSVLRMPKSSTATALSAEERSASAD